MRRPATVPLLLLTASVGCTDDTAGLDGGPSVDAGPAALEFCSGAYWDLDEQGELTHVEIPCARGAICADGVGATLCQEGEEDTYGTYGGNVVPRTIAETKDEYPDYPWCRQTEPSTSSDRCVFQAGCTDPIGLWCLALSCGSNAFFAVDECEREPSCQLVYCGCDGQTYEGLPFRPYAHPGPCR